MCSTCSVPLAVMRRIVPQPPSPVPPNPAQSVVPYSVPSTVIKLPAGFSPSEPPPKLYRTFSAPVVVTLGKGSSFIVIAAAVGRPVQRSVHVNQVRVRILSVEAVEAMQHSLLASCANAVHHAPWCRRRAVKHSIYID